LLLALVPAALAQSVGLSPVGSLHLDNPELQGDAGPQEFDKFATTLAAGDLDGDGFSDLVVGLPLDDGSISAPLTDSGSVMFYRGGPAGPAAMPTRVLRQLPGAGLEEADQHGAALAVCDFDGDGFGDLAVGAPEEALDTIVAGAVLVYPGAPGGPGDSEFALLTQNTFGIPDQAESGDRFGAALACGDFNANGYDDLAIAAPDETLGEIGLAGWVVVIPGSPAGLVPTSALAFTQLQPEIASDPEDGDRFGSSLAAGDLDGDGFVDLAVGSSGEDLLAGAVHVLFGSLSGVTAIGSMLITDESLGGLSEAGDQLGRALAFGDFDGDGFDDLVVGIPRETFATSGGPVARAGQVAVVYGGGSIPTLGRVEYWAENNIHGAGTSEEDDHFGEAIVAGDFDGDGFDDLAIGHPGETLLVDEDGALTVLGGTPAGLSTSRRRRFEPAFEGLPGPPVVVSLERQFALSLAAADFNGDGYTDLVIGSPQLNTPATEGAGGATVLFGALFADGFESGHAGRWSPQS
jgi:hypothetical protein